MGYLLIVCISIMLLLHPFYAWSLTNNPRETPIVQVVRQNAASVVNISTERIILLRETPFWGHYGNDFDFFFGQFFDDYYPGRALKLKSVGSGVIIDGKGIIVTNAHVVHMAANIYVVLNNGTSLPGTVVYENLNSDLALIKISPTQELEAVKMGQTHDIMIGETAIAIGNPLGLENSVTAGVISGKGRELTARGTIIAEHLLQTDAPINPGNSGGALLNLNGELIGINMAVVQNSQSIGFAIPVERVKEALQNYHSNPPVTLRTKTQNPANQTQLSTIPSQRLSLGPSEEHSSSFEEIERMQEETEDMFQSIIKRGRPSQSLGMFKNDFFYDPQLQVNDTKEAYVLTIELKGIDRDTVDVKINDYSIAIKGQYSRESRTTHPTGTCQSKRLGSFFKTIPLPKDADETKVTSQIENDVLTIRIPKT